MSKAPKSDTPVIDPKNQAADPPPVEQHDPAAPAQATSIEATAQEQVNNAPKASLGVVERHEERAKERGLKDKADTLFDPKNHESDKDGKPRLSKAGNFMKKRGNRGGTIGSVANKSTTGDVAVLPQAGKEPSEATKVAGTAMTQMTAMVGLIIGGDDWKPGKSPINDQIDENALLNDAWTNYLHSKGVEDVPPGFALVFAMFIYSAPRFMQQRTKERIGKGVGWAWKKVKSWWSNRGGSHADKRNDGVREKHIREETTSGLQEERSNDNRS